MDENHTGNGRVQFGPAAGNSIPVEWIGPVMTALFAQYRDPFGKVIAEVAAKLTTGVDIKASKARQ